MTTEEAKHKLDFMKKAYQKLIDEKVDSGKLVGDGVRGEWKAEAPLDEAYKDMIEALDMAIKALKQENVFDKIRAEIEDLTYYCWEVSPRTVIDDVLEIIDKYKAEREEV